MDIVYNYFTENLDSKGNEPSMKSDMEILVDIKNKLLNNQKEEDY